MVMKTAPRKMAVLPAAAADGLADADSRSAGNAERNHVGERDGVERDLVCRERDGTEPRDESRD
jgi:hypothetical protein